MEAVLEGKLIDCLDALERGETLEEILRRYPDDAAALRPLLETAQQLATLPIGYSVNSQRRSRNAFLQEAAQLRDGQRRRPFFPWLWRPQLNASFVAAALVVMIMGALLFTLWDDLQPDQTLAPNETMTIPALIDTETPSVTPTVEAMPTQQETPAWTESTSTPEPQETPAPLSTATATPTMTNSPTGTATATATPTSTPTRPTYTPTSQPSDTPQPPVPPTVTLDDDNENENQNENDNENENENENNSGPGNGNDNDD